MVIFATDINNDRGGIRCSEEAEMIGKWVSPREPVNIVELDLMARTVISNQVGGKYEQ